MTNIEEARERVIRWAMVVTDGTLAISYERKALSAAVAQLRTLEKADAEDQRIRAIAIEEIAKADIARRAEAKAADVNWAPGTWSIRDDLDDVFRPRPKKAKKGKKK